MDALVVFAFPIVFVFAFLKFLLVEYCIWYPFVCFVCFFHFTLKPFDFLVSLEMLVPFGVMRNVFFTVPV